MLPNHLRLNRLKRSGTHMQRQLTAADATAVKVDKRALREVQPGSRCCYRTLDVGIDGLIILRVARLGVAVQIWRIGISPTASRIEANVTEPSLHEKRMRNALPLCPSRSA